MPPLTGSAPSLRTRSESVEVAALAAARRLIGATITAARLCDYFGGQRRQAVVAGPLA